MSWLGLVLLGSGVPAIDLIEWGLGSVGVLTGIYMAATE
jgi:tetrahydromethanopterin S-methyltransferase subunit C